MTPVIAHIDMDAFFAAVEQRDNPSLRGRPVVIGADPKGGRGRGVVSTCSYEARRFGIHSAMPISQAWRRCPQAVYLPVRGGHYRRVSDRIFSILHEFTPDVEAVSIDEAFLDLTGCWHLHKSVRQTCLTMKARIKDEVGLTASIGVAPVKMAAKIASDLCKPDGFLEVRPEALRQFLWALPVERLWGVGRHCQAVLNRMGITRVEQLAKASKEMLYDRLGEHGLHLHDLANGLDPRRVEIEDRVKSVSNEHTFDRDTAEAQEVLTVLLALSEKVSRRLRQQALEGKTVSIKIRLKGFKTYTRAAQLEQRSNHADIIYRQAKRLFQGFYRTGMEIRLIGVRVSGFHDPYVAPSLFSDPSKERREQVHRALDAIKDRFGEGAIRRGFLS